MLLVQFLVCLAVIGYFNRVGRVTGADWLKTLAAPAAGAIAQGVVMYLLVNNLSFLAGGEVRVVKLIPLYVAVIAAAGFLYALWLRSRDPDRYATIGDLHDDELEELFVDEQYVESGLMSAAAD